VDDALLLERARQGDEDAFSSLFARYQRSLFKYAAYMCGRDAGDDVVQETFLVLLKQKERQDAPTGSLGGYLFGIARHVVLKRLAARGGEVLVELRDEVMEDAEATHDVSVVEALTRSETVDAIRRAVHSLPALYREAVVLCELQEMDYAAAARVIQCPVGTVRSRLHRAKAMLMTKLEASAIRQQV
jgi:RNA polymerase sigma-70 factor (ECF subfamily)